jgi:hypothetical protein
MTMPFTEHAWFFFFTPFGTVSAKENVPKATIQQWAKKVYETGLYPVRYPDLTTTEYPRYPMTATHPLGERQEVMDRLQRHIASCQPCQAVGGLDAHLPSLYLCPRAQALLNVWETLSGSNEPLP